VFTISIALPELDEKSVKELKKILDSFEQASEKGPVRGGIASEGEAAAYAMVWEWGNARQEKKGPKTVLGVNPDGETVWLSTQAPLGYIRIHEAEYVRIIEDQLGAADFGSLETGKEVLGGMVKASLKAANMITELLREYVPVDSGDLRDSLGPMDPLDPDLAFRDHEMELGDPAFTHKGLSRAFKDVVKRIKK